MGYRENVLHKGLLAVLLSTGAAWASDDVACEMPNPFAPIPIQTENKGAKWRHGFHKVRTTWDKYFDVYPDGLAGYDEVLFDKVLSDPSFYQDRKIQFDVYYGKNGTFFRPFLTPFRNDAYVNFSAWPYSAELWTKSGRGRLHPLFYVDRRKNDLIESLSHLPTYQPIRIWAMVISKTEGLPWFEVMGMKQIPETVLTDEVLKHIEMGEAQLAKKRDDLAAQAFEVALRLEMPVQAETKVYGMLGRAYYEMRQYPLAREALVNAILRDDSNVPNLVLLARADTRTDRALEAKQAAEHALTLDPSNADARAELGLALAMLGDTRDAYKELDYSLKLAPRGQLAEAFRNRAMVALLENRPEVAESELSKALLLRPTDFGLHMELGDVYLLRNRLDKAQLEYSQSKELASNRPEPYYKTAVVIKKQADLLLKENKADEAKKLFEEALKNVQDALVRDPQFTAAYGLQAELLRALNREDESTKVLEKGAEANPKNPAMQDVLYEQALVRGDFAAAETAARAALALRPTARNYSHLGYALSNRPQPDYAGAAAAFAEAVKLMPDNAQDWAALGHLRARNLNDYAGADAALCQSLKLQPANAEGWVDLAFARRNLGDTEGAALAAGEALNQGKTVQARLLDAQVRLDRDQKDDLAVAVDEAKSAVADAATEAEKAAAQAVYGQVLLKAGKTAEALEALNAAAACKDNAEYQLALGTALLKSGDLPAAREHLKQAEKLLPAVALSAVDRRVQHGARKELSEADHLAKAQESKPQPEAAKTEQPAKQTPEAAQNLPPVIEEPAEGTPVPAQVPGPR